MTEPGGSRGIYDPGDQPYRHLFPLVPTYLLSATSFWRKVSTMVSRSFTLEMVVSPGTASGGERSGPFSAASLSWLTSAMLKLNRQNERVLQPLPTGPPIGGQGMPVTEPDGAGQSPETRSKQLGLRSGKEDETRKKTQKPKFRGSIKTFNYISKISYSATVNIRS